MDTKKKNFPFNKSPGGKSKEKRQTMSLTKTCHGSKKRQVKREALKSHKKKKHEGSSSTGGREKS